MEDELGRRVRMLGRRAAGHRALTSLGAGLLALIRDQALESEKSRLGA